MEFARCQRGYRLLPRLAREDALAIAFAIAIAVNFADTFAAGDVVGVMLVRRVALQLRLATRFLNPGSA